MKVNVDHIILASGSPRRKEMFEQMGFSFEIIKSVKDEKITESKPDLLVMELAGAKAKEVRDHMKKDGLLKEGSSYLIVGADTIVTLDKQVLLKPKDEEDALCTLRKLSGREHSVYTGVNAIYIGRDGIEVEENSLLFAEETLVKMYPFSEQDAKDYIATKEPMDKAGSYGIQGLGGLLVKGIEGDYNNVVGFPMSAFVHRGCQKNLFRLY